MKKKGTKAERELLHLFYNNNWMPIRAAGSGSTTIPCPDILTANTKRSLAIECKSIKNNQKTFKPEEINQLLEFSTKFGAEAWIAIKFNNKGWYFIEPKNIKKTKNNNYSITLNHLKENGIRFDDIIKG